MKHRTAQVEGLAVSGHTDVRSCPFPAPGQVLSQDDVLCSAWRQKPWCWRPRRHAGALVCGCRGTRVHTCYIANPGVGMGRHLRAWCWPEAGSEVEWVGLLLEEVSVTLEKAAGTGHRRSRAPTF